MDYIYGPIKSRRLGLSLGISLSKDKICDLDCIYCQWGSVKKTFSGRKEYAGKDDILNELSLWIKTHPEEFAELKFVTFSGFGEPTLHSLLGELIVWVKKMTGAKIAVITNSTLLGDPAVRKELLNADLIVPSLDAVDPQIFKKIDRPDSSIELNKIIEGLVALRKEFKGQIWLEIMLVKGLNDTPEHIKHLKEISDRINPDKIQLNSPVRKPAEKEVYPLEPQRLKEIKDIFGSKAEII